LIADLASARRGLVTRDDLLAAGVGKGAIDHRVATGRLIVRYRGVYAVGHAALTPRAERLAAVIACGEGAVLSHRSAAVEWGMLLEDAVDVHEVTTPRHRMRPGIRTHEGTLPPDDLRVRYGVPLTAPVRTLLDVAPTLDSRELERALERARIDGLLTPEDLDALVRRAAGRRGARALRALLADGPAFTRSEAERALLALVRRAGLPMPRTNVRVEGHEVDAFWPAHGLVLEVDGYRFHRGRAAFERDRRRDADLTAAGHRVVRMTWDALRRCPEAVAARLAGALARTR